MDGIVLDIPKGFTAKDVAEVFSAYLLGSTAFLNHDKKFGPFAKNSERWQLDGSNDYWLNQTEETKVAISWRYHNQQKVAVAMVMLFNARYNSTASATI